MKFSDLDRQAFPKNFLWGSATSSYQIEGHGFGGAGLTHWDTFAATPGNVVGAQNGTIACDHYHRFEEDLDLIAEAGLDTYRFSASWARVLPEGRGTANAEGLDFYDRLIDAMLERNIKPLLTLYHWELPVPLADLGGWRNPDIAHWFGDYTDTLMSRIGDRVWGTAPINEPWCVAWLSHFMGEHAPGLRDVRAAAHAMHNVLRAHGTAIQVMRAQGLNNLGLVCNFEWSEPASDLPEDHEAAARYDAIYNRFFLSGVFKKSYPDLVLKGLESHLPKGWANDFDLISTPVDWCGLNYYTRKLIARLDDPWPSLGEVAGPLEHTQVGWEIYPEGLFNFLTRTKEEYTHELPLYVTENGLALAGEVSSNDARREDYLAKHLQEVLRAKNAGVPVEGYCIWSLLDNYEWALGYEPRFGLVHVDFKTLQRTPKPSYWALKDFLGQRG